MIDLVKPLLACMRRKIHLRAKLTPSVHTIECTTSRKILCEYTSPPIGILRSFSDHFYFYAHNLFIKLDYITSSWDFFIHSHHRPANGSGQCRPSLPCHCLAVVHCRCHQTPSNAAIAIERRLYCPPLPQLPSITTVKCQHPPSPIAAVEQWRPPLPPATAGVNRHLCLTIVYPYSITRDMPTIKGEVYWPWLSRSLGGSPRLFSPLSIDYE